MTGPDGSTPASPSHDDAPADNPAQATWGHSSNPTPAPASGTSELTSLVSRQFAVPVAALALGIVAIVVSAAMFGVSFFGKASDGEVCSSYRAAERSWDAYDTDAEKVMELSAVASRHPDGDISSAGKRLKNLPSTFSYGQYASIVQPIAQLC